MSTAVGSITNRNLSHKGGQRFHKKFIKFLDVFRSIRHHQEDIDCNTYNRNTLLEKTTRESISYRTIKASS